MATPVYLKKMTWTMEEGLIGKWLKHEGDKVSEGEGLCEVETEKTTDEIQAPASGTLLTILHKEGTAVPVNALIAIIGSPGEDVSSIPLSVQPIDAAGAQPAPLQKTEPAPVTLTISEAPEPSLERIRISPSARRLAR